MQVPQSWEHDSALEQAGERTESASPQLGLVASSPGAFFGASPPRNRQSSLLNFNLRDNGGHQISDENPSSLSTLFIASAETSSPSGASLYCEPQAQMIPVQQLDTEPPDIIFTQHEESNPREFLPANSFTPDTGNANSFPSNDTRTGAIVSLASPIRTPPLPSNAPSLSRDSFLSREADSSPRLVDATALAAHADEFLASRKRKERVDDDSEWLRLYLHDHILEPTDE
jgi:hypothetical protein